MKQSIIVRQSGSIVWIVDGKETQRIPDYPIYDLVFGPVCKSFNTNWKIPSVCLSAVCMGLEPEQVQRDILRDVDLCVIITMMFMFADFYDDHVKRQQRKSNNPWL